MTSIKIMRFTFDMSRGILSKGGTKFAFYLALQGENGYNIMVIMPLYAVLQERAPL